jgi:transposase-like protein
MNGDLTQQRETTPDAPAEGDSFVRPRSVAQLIASRLDPVDPRARLTVFGRQLLIARVEAGWPAAHVAEQLGISRATAFEWIRRHRAEGPAGLADRTSRPRRSPRRLDSAAEAEILAARTTWRYDPDRLGPLLGRMPRRFTGSWSGAASSALATPSE